jgi:virginiamycin B lyase
MAHHRALLVVLLLGLVSVTNTAAPEEVNRDARIEVTLPRSGTVMVAGFDSLWMMDTTTNKLDRIHMGDNSVTEIPINGVVGPFWASGMAVGEGGVWVPDLERSMVYKIDPLKEQVVKEMPADLVGGRGPGGKYAIAVGENAVWAISSNNELRRYSVEGGAQEAAISLPSRSSGVIVAFGSVWVTGTANDELYRVDPATNQIAATIELRSDPRAVAEGEGSVWVYNEGDGTVQRIDGKSGKVVATIETGAVGKGALAVGGGFVWVSTHDVPIVQIDPRSNSVRGKFKVEMAEYSAICFGGGSLWVSGGSLRRIRPPE